MNESESDEENGDAAESSDEEEKGNEVDGNKKIWTVTGLKEMTKKMTATKLKVMI